MKINISIKKKRFKEDVLFNSKQENLVVFDVLRFEELKGVVINTFIIGRVIYNLEDGECTSILMDDIDEEYLNSIVQRVKDDIKKLEKFNIVKTSSK